jgi:hypothetical protein
MPQADSTVGWTKTIYDIVMKAVIPATTPVFMSVLFTFSLNIFCGTAISYHEACKRHKIFVIYHLSVPNGKQEMTNDECQIFMTLCTAKLGLWFLGSAIALLTIDDTINKAFCVREAVCGNSRAY